MIHRWRMERVIAELVDGDLTEPRRSRLLRHLERCPECARLLRSYLETDRLLSETCPVPVRVPADPERATFRRALAASGILYRSPYRLGWGIATLTVLAASLVWRLPGFGKHARPVLEASGKTGARPDSHPETALAHSLCRTSAQTGLLELSNGPAPEPELVSTHRMLRLPARRWSARARRQRHLPPRRGATPGILSPTPEAPEPLLVVKLTSGSPAPLLEVSSREVPPDTPGFARAGAWRQGTDGSLIWTQSTVASDRPGPELVLLPNLSCE